MLQMLPEGDFKWRYFFTIDDVKNWDPEGDVGYFVEVDAIIPTELHDKLSNLPPFPATIKITDDMLSEVTMKARTEQYGTKNIPPMKKLVPNLSPKFGYIVHVSALQLYLKLGGQITRIGRVLQFKQSRWLAPYISFNTQKRMDSTTDFKKSFYKLMINSYFGRNNILKYF